MKEIVQCEMTEHDEHRIRSILAVLGRSLPLFIGEFLETFNEPLAIGDELRECLTEIHLHQQIVGILFAGQVWANHRRWFTEHLIEPLKEQRMYIREMTRVLVS